MPIEDVVELCRSAPSIAAELAKDPTQSVDDVVKRLRKEWKAKQKQDRRTDLKNERQEQSKDRLDRAAECGNFPVRPSNLFLEVRSLRTYMPNKSKIFRCKLGLCRCTRLHFQRSLRKPRFSITHRDLRHNPTIYRIRHSRHNAPLRRPDCKR